MDLLGIDRQRLHLKWVSASEGNIFAQEIRSFTERLRGLGKNPLAEKKVSRLRPRNKTRRTDFQSLSNGERVMEQRAYSLNNRSITVWSAGCAREVAR